MANQLDELRCEWERARWAALCASMCARDLLNGDACHVSVTWLADGVRLEERAQLAWLAYQSAMAGSD